MKIDAREHALDRAFEQIAHGTHADLFSILGPHAADVRGSRGTIVRAWHPAAERVQLVRMAAGKPHAPRVMTRRHPAGIFEVELDHLENAGNLENLEYVLRITYPGLHTIEIDDPYRYGRILSDFDLHLLGEGTHYRSYEKLGAHLITVGGAAGVHFAVWAPNAHRVSVIGNFNGWDGRVHVMRPLVPGGFWELFVPGLGEGEPYKFEIRSAADGSLHQKADPYGFAFELPPASASVVRRLDRYDWRDAVWLRARGAAHTGHDRPMSTYEVHLGSFMQGDNGRWLTYRELGARLIPYVREMGFTHIELLPVMEHPYSGSWGYQVTGFFAPTSRFGPPEDFKWFVDECHEQGIGVILDWVPGHFPKDAHGLARFDGTALYEHADPRQGEHQEWGTLVFNYGRSEVRNFLLSNALFWLDEYHIDGLRVDAVASMLYLDYSRQPGQWIPNRFGGRENLDAVEFLKQLNMLTHDRHPGSVTIAEESTAFPGVSRPVHLGGLGFTYKWNMGWMHDMLHYMQKDPVHRRWEHNKITFSMLYAFTENFILPFSHDEVVHGKRSMLAKMPGDAWRKRANLRALYGYMYAHPGKKLLFMGCEFGQWREWNHDRSLDWHLLEDPAHEGIRRFVRDVNALHRRERSLHEVDFDGSGFQWLDCNDHENSIISFVRRARRPGGLNDVDDFIVVVINFTPVVREGYLIGVPEEGTYREVLNSDAAVYGGSDVGNAGAARTEPLAAHGHPHSLHLTLPPLACVFLKPSR